MFPLSHALALAFALTDILLDILAHSASGLAKVTPVLATSCLVSDPEGFIPLYGGHASHLWSFFKIVVVVVRRGVTVSS